MYSIMIQIDESSKSKAMDKLREISKQILDDDLKQVIDKNVIADRTWVPYYYVFNGERKDHK